MNARKARTDACIHTCLRAGVRRPRLGVHEHRFGHPKPRLVNPNPKLGDPKPPLPRFVVPTRRFGVPKPMLGLLKPRLEPRFGVPSHPLSFCFDLCAPLRSVPFRSVPLHTIDPFRMPLFCPCMIDVHIRTLWFCPPRLVEMSLRSGFCNIRIIYIYIYVYIYTQCIYVYTYI